MEKKQKWILGCGIAAAVGFLLLIAVCVGGYFAWKAWNTYETSEAIELMDMDDTDSVAIEVPDAIVDYTGSGHYEGTMGGFPIELDLNVDDTTGTASATYHNVKYGTTIQMSGSYGADGSTELEGDGLFIGLMVNGEDEIQGYGKTDGKVLEIVLNKK